MVATWSGLVSKSTTREGGRSASASTRVPVSIRPPRERRYPASAPVIAADPPCAIGQVSTCAVIRKSRPTAALTGRLRGRIEWAAQPASSARARSPRNQVRPRTVAGSRAGTPKPPSRSGWWGRWAGPRISAMSSRGWRSSGRISRRYAAASGRSPSAVASSELRRMTAGSPSSGWATDAAGWIQVSPCSASGRVRR